MEINNKKINGKKVVVTFDDGKEGVYINALPILEKYNIPATIFIIESKIDTEGYLTSDEINDIKDSHPLISLESHSVNLHNEENAKSDYFDIYNEDMKLSKEKNYNYFAYPYGYSNDNYIRSLKDNNYKLAFKFSPSKWVNKKDDNYLLGRVPIYNSNSKFKFILKLYIKK